MRLAEVGIRSLLVGVDMRRFAVGVGSRPLAAVESYMGLAHSRSLPTVVSEHNSKTLRIRNTRLRDNE